MGDVQTETPDYLVQLNEQQRAAVLYTEGPQLVIAGAGSGKTRVLAYKIVHLLSHGYEPWRIMALTFTNKAAREMRERISPLVGAKAASRILMGTFHSVFARMLRSNAKLLGLNRNYTIYDAADSRNLLLVELHTQLSSCIAPHALAYARVVQFGLGSVSLLQCASGLQQTLHKEV